MDRLVRQQHLDKGLRGWIVNHSRRNYWRIAAWYDLEDLIQDGYMCYARCNQKHDPSRTQAQFASYVKLTFTNHIHDLASKRTRQEKVEEQLSLSLNSNFTATLEEAIVEPAEADFNTLVRQLPKELLEMIQILLSDRRPRQKMAQRETHNEYLCRLVGIDPNINVQALFRAHFS